MSGRGGAGGRGPLLDRDEFRLISSYWPEYFPDEVCAWIVPCSAVVELRDDRLFLSRLFRCAHHLRYPRTSLSKDALRAQLSVYYNLLNQEGVFIRSLYSGVVQKPESVLIQRFIP